MADRLIEKMKKLLAMSKDSSEKEAMIAAKQLQVLLAKHNLSMSEIEIDPIDLGELRLENQINWPWKRTIAKGIAELYFCNMYFIPFKKNYAHYVVVGEETNRIFATTLIERVFKIIEISAREECKDTYGKIVSSFLSSYKNGASIRVYQRCRKMIEEAKKGELVDEKGETLPALVDAYEQALKRTLEFMGPMRRVKSSSRIADKNAYQAGQRKGDTVGLSREIQSKSSPKLVGR